MSHTTAARSQALELDTEDDDDCIYDAVLRFTTTTPIVNDEPSDYLLGVHGALVLEGDPDREIGSIWLRIVQYGRILNERQSLLDVCDCIDQSVYEHAHAVFDFDRDDFREGMFEGFDGLDVMMIESLSIVPEFRGLGLGLACITRAIDAFGSGVAGVVLKPFPPQFASDYRGDAAPLYAGFETDFTRATQKLQRYYRKLGFRAVAPGSSFYALDLSAVTLPKSEALLAG